MRAVAVGFVLGVLALAEEGGFLFLGLEDEGREFGGLVGAVAEGLALGQSAGAPSISFSGFQFHFGGEFRGDRWLGHTAPPLGIDIYKDASEV